MHHTSALKMPNSDPPLSAFPVLPVSTRSIPRCGGYATWTPKSPRRPGFENVLDPLRQRPNYRHDTVHANEIPRIAEGNPPRVPHHWYIARLHPHPAHVPVMSNNLDNRQGGHRGPRGNIGQPCEPGPSPHHKLVDAAADRGRTFRLDRNGNRPRKQGGVSSLIYGLKSQPVKKFASALLRFQSETKVDFARGERIKCCLIARHVFGYNRGRGTKSKSVRHQICTVPGSKLWLSEKWNSSSLKWREPGNECGS